MTQTIQDLKEELLVAKIKFNDRGIDAYIITEFVKKEGHRVLKNGNLGKTGRMRLIQVYKELGLHSLDEYEKRLRKDPSYRWGW